MLVLCGPRGSGKGYLSKQLVGDFPDFFGMGYVVAYLPDKHTVSNCSSVSHTTRQIRKDEEQGKDYSFVSRDIFLKGIETVKFILSQTKTNISKFRVNFWKLVLKMITYLD